MHVFTSSLFSLLVLVGGLSICIGAAAASDEEVQAGAVLYTQSCSICHQADAIGKPGFAPSLTNEELLSTASDKFLLTTIRDGRAGTGMPPFAHLGRAAITAIVAYLRSHSTAANKSALHRIPDPTSRTSRVPGSKPISLRSGTTPGSAMTCLPRW